MATKRKFEIGDAVMVKKTGDFGMITGYSTPWYYVDGYTKYTANQLEKAGDENFTYGDRVRVIENTGTLEVGEVGTIIAKDVDGTYLFESDTDSEGKHRGHDYGIEWGRCGKMGESRCGWVFPYEVEKIVEEVEEVKQEETEVKDKFKMGDKVICKKEGTFGFSVGETGTVIAKMLGNGGHYLIRHDVPNQCCHTGSCAEYAWGKSSRKSDCTNEIGDKFELIENYDKKEEIHITRKGREVHAILKKDGKLAKRTVAKCHPDDEFDFETGAKLAVNRLYGTEEYGTIKGKIVKCDEYKGGDKVLVKSEKQVDSEKLFDVFPNFVWPMRKYCDKVITLGEKMPDETFLYEDFRWGKDFFVGKVVK